MTQQRSRSRRGSAIVETSLILPLFLIFWFGIADWGITYWMHQTVVHRANMAARWAVVNDWAPSTVRNLVVYGKGTGTGPGIFGLSAQVNDNGTGTNVDVTLRCITTETPKLKSGGDCLAEKWASARWIEIVVHDLQWSRLTPYFAGRYTARQVIVSLPTESLETNPI